MIPFPVLIQNEFPVVWRQPVLEKKKHILPSLLQTFWEWGVGTGFPPQEAGRMENLPARKQEARKEALLLLRCCRIRALFARGLSHDEDRKRKSMPIFNLSESCLRTLALNMKDCKPFPDTPLSTLVGTGHSAVVAKRKPRVAIAGIDNNMKKAVPIFNRKQSLICMDEEV